ncbi:MAG: HAMP domain-containing histidine kinase, partial [Anaerolineales bacterium]|nr:HAMP domain-containing histidine kinase [Anaerolineales bacterium]
MQKKFVDQIKISTLKLNSLINNLVNITTIQRIEDRTKLGAYDVCGIIDEALIESNPIIRNKKLVLRMNLPGDLPEITTDQQILKETVSGLILNASQVSPEGSNLTVTVQLNKGFLDEDYFLIQITDSGGGIEPEDLIHVYTEVNEPLRIIHGISNVDIDFSLIKDQIEEINGRVWVDSVPGEGTVFSILLPVT